MVLDYEIMKVDFDKHFDSDKLIPSPDARSAVSNMDYWSGTINKVKGPTRHTIMWFAAVLNPD